MSTGPERCARPASFRRSPAARRSRRSGCSEGRDNGGIDMAWQRAIRCSGLARVREELTIEPGERLGFHVWDLAKFTLPGPNAAVADLTALRPAQKQGQPVEHPRNARPIARGEAKRS